jgi:hypothetical protein
MELLRLAGLGLLIGLSAQTAHAELITVDGGTLTASVSAGTQNNPDYIYSTDTPAPLTPVAGTITSLTAYTVGTTYPFYAADHDGTVTSTALGSTDIHSDASGTTLALSAIVDSDLVQIGAGNWCCGTAESSVVLLFTLTQDALVTFDSNGWQPQVPGLSRGQVTALDTGVLVFEADQYLSVHKTLLLAAGRYRALLEAVEEDNGSRFVRADVELTMTVTPIPVPAAIWLFGSALTGLAAARRRRSRDGSSGCRARS